MAIKPKDNIATKIRYCFLNPLYFGKITNLHSFFLTLLQASIGQF